jgi:transcriptional regulator MraZ
VFFGRHERQLDDKGRVALPAPYRRQLGDRLYLVNGANRCIDVFPAEDFEARALELAERARRGEETDARRRTVGHTATEVTVDGQGRIKVDERLRDFARLALQSKVVVTGGIDRVELWSESYLADVVERANAELAGSGA